MKITASLAATALLLAVTGVARAQTATPAAPAAALSASRIDPAVMSALDASRAYLRTLKSFELRAESTVDEVEPDDLKLEVINQVRYDYRKPNKLFVDWRTDRQSRRIFFDGKALTIYAPRVGLYASVPETGTVGDLLDRVAAKYGLDFPLPDIFQWSVGTQPVYNLKSAAYVGYARIAGADTDQYVFRQDDVDWQVWIERGARPLPRKIVITTRTDPTQPKFSALLQWNVDVALPDSQFVYTPAAGAKPVTVVQVNPKEAK